MKEPEIVVLSGENRFDQWGNFLFKDKGGREHKIGAKRNDKDQLAVLVNDNPNKGIRLTWDVYERDGTQYDIIKGIEVIEGELPVYVPPQEVPRIDTPKSREDGMREGLWWNNLGNRIGDGSLDRDFPKSAVEIKSQYYKEMSEVTGVDFKIEKKED